MNGLGMGCRWLVVPPPRSSSAGVEWLVTVSEPQFLIMFPPGVAPTLGWGDGPGGGVSPICFPEHFSGEKNPRTPAPFLSVQSVHFPLPPTRHGAEWVSPICFPEHFLGEKNPRTPAPFLSVQVLSLCASCQAVHLAWPGVTHHHPAVFPIGRGSWVQTVALSPPSIHTPV